MKWIAVFLFAIDAAAQVSPESTRFTVVAAPILSQPGREFRSNVGSSFGGGAGVLYHLDRPGILSLRFDVSGVDYGRETKRRVPLSPTIGGRILVDVTTTNSITALSFVPELALPKGPLRPYLNVGFSELLFRTTSSVRANNSSDDEDIASTTNYKDRTGALVFGGGVRIPMGVSRIRKMINLDAGVRYYRGGSVSYLREGSIQDSADGSIRISPLSSRTPHVVYLIGLRIRIPHDAASPCHRLLC
jgi:hypothetical protein